jgi:hypothetical protein
MATFAAVGGIAEQPDVTAPRQLQRRRTAPTRSTSSVLRSRSSRQRLVLWAGSKVEGTWGKIAGMANNKQSSIDAKRLWLVIALLCGLAAIVAVSIFLVLWLGGAPQGRPRAVIVDQLAITDPNPNFVTSATRQLEAAGYAVDYFPPEAVTVDFYRDLPKRGYDFVILRSHSSSERIARRPVLVVGATPFVTTGVVSEQTVGLFTTERYSTKRHIYEQLKMQLSKASYPGRDIEESYFGVHPEFIADAAEGRFKKTVVILMGCGGLTSDSMAKAFVSKGATSFISWSDSVTAQHTDASTEDLLRHLVGDGMDAREAVAKTMSEVGPDPAFGSSLLAYP